MKESYSSLSVAIAHLQNNGYTEDFNLIEVGITSKALQKEWKAHGLDVVKFYRFEGISDPGDNTILYAIETSDGHKGLLVDVYGANSSSISLEMIKKLRINYE
jgi:hypothetical protein